MYNFLGSNDLIGKKTQILVLTKEVGRGDGLGSDLDLDPDPWEILWIRIRQNDSDPLDADSEHCKNQHGLNH